MAALVPTIKDKELFVNWLKGALALSFAKQGLEDFVSDELTDFQKDLLAAIFQNKALPAGTACNSCTTENVLDCPTQNFCPKGKCKIHDPGQADKRPNQPCPNKICQDIRDGIRREHRYDRPSWKNTDARRWSNDAFEIAKCYMPPDGYTGAIKLADADFNGTLAVIINNKRFQHKMAAKLNQQNNVCIKAREVGRSVRHSADLNLTDTELVQYTDILIDLLSDPKYLAVDQKAQEAVDKLKQLKSNTLTVTTADITAILDSTIKDRQEEALQAIKDVTDEAKEKNQEKIKASIQLMEDAKAATANLQTVLVSSLIQIIAAKQSSLVEIKTETEKQKQEIAKAGAKEREKIEKGGLSSHLTKILVLDTFLREEVELNMKEDLIKFYRKYHSNIPVSPLVEEHDVPLTDFYVQPPLSSIDVQRKYGGQYRELPKRTLIQSYWDLFLHGDGELYKDVYITAKAGIGKTSFAKNICMTWCQAHRPIEMLERKFKPEDIILMKKFEFLFMVSLRDIDTSMCDLDDMIDSSLLHSLARSSQYSRRHLEDILNERTCLVILDGLDEWTHHLYCSRGGGDIHAIPHIPARDRCTVMTTTRPWKLDVVKLGTNQIDRHVEINELDELSSKELIRNAVNVLNNKSSQDQSQTVEGFKRATSTLKLDNLQYIPYILLQIICLWFDGKSIGRTKCEIYTNIITLTLSRGLKKLKTKGLPLLRSRKIASTSENPAYSQLSDIVKSNYEVLISLGKLAFEKLFSSKAEGSLVFDRCEVLSILSEDIITFCLKIGLLSHTQEYGSVSERRCSLSFQHKSIQEYFAALYIQSCYEDQDIQESIRKMCNTLPVVLEMANVFVFLAGLSSPACGKCFHIVKLSLFADENIEVFRNSDTTCHMYVPRLREYWNIMKSWQSVLTESVQEILNNHGERNIPLYIEDIIIDSTVTLDTCAILKILSEDSNDKIKSISISQCRSTEEFSEKLKTLDLQDMHLLHRLLIEAVPKEKDLNRLLSGSVHTLTCLILDFTVFNDNKRYRKITEMSSETVGILLNMNSLQIIYLEDILLKHADIERLFQYLMARQTMTLIRLFNIACKDHDRCNGFCLGLAQNKNLKNLDLGNVPVSTLHVDASSMEVCEVGQLQPAVQSSLVKCLQEAKNLIRVSFNRFQSEQANIIIDTLSMLPKLETFAIQRTDLGDATLALPPQIDHLESVYLNMVTLTGTSLKRLIGSVDVMPQQVTVEMLRCVVKPKTDYSQEKERIRSSPKYQVVFDGLNEGEEELFQFQTWNK